MRCLVCNKVTTKGEFLYRGVDQIPRGLCSKKCDRIYCGEKHECKEDKEKLSEVPEVQG